MHTFPSSVYTLSGIYIDDLRKLIILITFSGKFQLEDQFISLIYTISHTNPWVSAGVHTLAKKKLF